MKPRRGLEGAAIVAKKAYAAYGWETTPEIVDAFYATLKGRSFPGALRAVERCFQHPGRTKPPTHSEVLGEMLIEAHEKARDAAKDRTWKSLNPDRLASDELLLKQMRMAREKHPDLFTDSGPLADLEKRIRARILPSVPNQFSEPAYNPGSDLDAPF
jgi:hypothetical protein